jgi:hypothetical protein
VCCWIPSWPCLSSEEHDFGDEVLVLHCPLRGLFSFHQEDVLLAIATLIEPLLIKVDLVHLVVVLWMQHVQACLVDLIQNKFKVNEFVELHQCRLEL